MGYTYNKAYLLKDNKPWFPVMGEFHYSRYREDLWEESLRKMKAGGVTVVATYAFWIHHEEEEGVYVFSGCRNVGKFLSICKKLDLPVFLRIGPWCHGEVRNGGFPDWLLEKEIPLRCDDPEYLAAHRDTVITAKIRVYEMLGAEVFLYFDYDGANMTARVKPDTKARTNDMIDFALDPEKIHVFDKETELTITN